MSPHQVDDGRDLRTSLDELVVEAERVDPERKPPTPVERIAAAMKHYEAALAEAAEAGVEPPAHPVNVAEAAKAETDPAEWSLAVDDLHWAAEKVEEWVRIERFGAAEAERRRAMKQVASTAVSYLDARRRVLAEFVVPRAAAAHAHYRNMRKAQGRVPGRGDDRASHRLGQGRVPPADVGGAFRP
jgi:hypothetical protein